MDLALLILPIAFTIACGQILVLTHVMPRESWLGIESLSFRLLIPAVLIKYISVSQLSVDKFGPMILSIVASLMIVGGIVLVLRRVISQYELSNASLSTLFQTTTRWNAFITLIAVELFVGADAIFLVAVTMAVLVPLINVLNIIVLSIYGTATASYRSVFKQVFTNPIVISCFIGLTISALEFQLPNPIIKTLDIIGGAAIGIGLLAVGAGVNLKRFFRSSIYLWLGVVLRLVAVPIIFILIASIIGLGEIEILVGVLILAVPTASNGYVIAKQMGGDASLLADILAWQVLISMLLLPIYVAYLS